MAADVLPGEIMRSVTSVNPLLTPFFDRGIEVGKRRRKSSIEVYIDYKSPRITANFDVLPMNNRRASVDRIVRRMWELEYDRDRTASPYAMNYEMLIEYPALELIDYSSGMGEKIKGLVGRLEEQADLQKIRLRPFANVRGISDRILEAEGFATT